MGEPSRLDDCGIYEVRALGEIPAALLRTHPELDVYSIGTETVLRRHLTDLTTLDQLLDQLQSLGLVLCELRESALPSRRAAETPQKVADRRNEVPDIRAARRSYEVHVEGRAGRALLQSISWSCHIQGRLSVLRVRGSLDGLAELLQTMTASGVTIERVARLYPGRDDTPTPRDARS